MKMVEIVINPFKLDETMEAVAVVAVDAARTGRTGDGKIFVLPALEAIRIRTRERGDTALG